MPEFFGHKNHTDPWTRIDNSMVLTTNNLPDTITVRENSSQSASIWTRVKGVLLWCCLLESKLWCNNMIHK